jgi:hypothetical protein
MHALRRMPTESWLDMLGSVSRPRRRGARRSTSVAATPSEMPQASGLP